MWPVFTFVVFETFKVSAVVSLSFCCQKEALKPHSFSPLSSFYFLYVPFSCFGNSYIFLREKVEERLNRPKFLKVMDDKHVETFQIIMCLLYKENCKTEAGNYT